MRFLKLSSLLSLLFLSCGSPYQKLSSRTATTSDAAYLATYKPLLPDKSAVLYRCSAGGKFLLKKFHLSGLLLFRRLPENGDMLRVVFSSEVGFTFFDFGWMRGSNGQDSFKVNRIIPQLDKPPVIKTLQKDLALLMIRKAVPERILQGQGKVYFQVPLEKGFGYYVVNKSTERLEKIEIAGKRKVATIYIYGNDKRSMPDSFSVVHRTAHFTINAKKLPHGSIE